VAKGTLNDLVPTNALNLGIVRALVTGTFLISVLVTSFSSLGHLPTTLLRPIGLMKIVPWWFYDRLVTPAGMTALKWCMVISLIMSTVGFLTVVTTKTSVLLVVFHQGLVRSFSHFNHDEMIAVLFLFILAFSPCGDAFSIDNRLRRKTRDAGLRYGYPILLMMILMSWVYFSSAVIKIRVAGVNYLSADNLPALAIYHSLDNLHGSHFKLAFLLPAIREYLPVVLAIVLLWELLFPLAVIWKRSRIWILGFGVVFHLGTLFFMNIFFPHHLAMYCVFIDWSRVAKRLWGGSGEAARLRLG
jgi:hypothetical protein